MQGGQQGAPWLCAADLLLLVLEDVELEAVAPVVGLLGPHRQRPPRQRRRLPRAQRSRSPSGHLPALSATGARRRCGRHHCHGHHANSSPRNDSAEGMKQAVRRHHQVICTGQKVRRNQKFPDSRAASMHHSIRPVKAGDVVPSTALVEGQMFLHPLPLAPLPGQRHRIMTASSRDTH